MYVLSFICSVVCICIGLFIENSENPIFERWEYILLAIILIVCGFIEAGVSLFHLVG